MENKRGITLIALIITIIILLILAGIVMNLVIGENGIIKMAQQAGRNYMNAAEYENKQLDEFANRMEETIQNTTGDVIISEPVWDPNTKKATVTITKRNNYNNAQIQYQVNATLEDNWTIGAIVTGLSYNDIVYARLWDGTNGGSPVKSRITDNIKPQDAIIDLSGTAMNLSSSITATITLVDNESGPDVTNSKCEYTNVKEPLGIDESKYTKSFSTNGEKLTLANTEPGIYYLHVLTKDIAGNYKETISSPITVLTQTSWSYGYEGREPTWVAPVTGYYNIACYGAQGGSGAQRGDSNTGGSASGGTKGTLRNSIVKIDAGTRLTIHVGGQGGNGNSAYSAQTGGSGGWNDGGKGTGSTQQGQSEQKYYCAYGGGGGGSSYITVSGTKIISAQGGAGGGAKRGPNGSTSYWTNGSGGSGGGTTTLNNATGTTWDTSQLNNTTSGAGSGNGRITITFVK